MVVPPNSSRGNPALFGKRQIMTNEERYTFLRQHAYKICMFKDGEHFTLELLSPAYSGDLFDKTLDKTIDDVCNYLKSKALDKLSAEEKELLGLI